MEQIYIRVLPFPSQILDRPSLQPRAKQDNVPKYKSLTWGGLKRSLNVAKVRAPFIIFTTEACY